MYAFMIPRRIRNAAFTELPMAPSTILYLSNLDDMLAIVATTTMDVIMKILWRNQPTGAPNDHFRALPYHADNS
jgi:hypothetical protein